MRIYYSGGSGLVSTPEALVPQRKPMIMLTFHDIRKGATAERLKSYLKRKRQEKK